MNHNFKNSFYHMSSERPSGYACFVFTVDIKKKYQHRNYEWHNCHGSDLLKEAFTKLASLFEARGIRTSINDDCLKMLTSTATNEAGDFNATKRFIEEHMTELNYILDV